MLNLASQNALTEQTHQIVSQHNHIQRRLGTVKIVDIETVKTKIILEFLNPIFRIRSLLIKIPYLLGWQNQIGNKTMISIMVVNVVALKKPQLLACRFRPLLNLLPPDHTVSFSSWTRRHGIEAKT